MRKSFKTTKTALATAVMVGLLSGGVMATGFAAPVEGISYSGGVLTPGSDNYIKASDILDKGGGATVTSLSEVKAELEGRIKVTEDLLAGDWGGETVQDAINVTAQAITDLETAETAAISALDLRMDAAESAIDSNINVIIPNIYKTIADLETTENGKIAGLDGRVTDAENAIPVIQQDISDLQTGKLDKAVYEADKADTKAALDGKANVALDNITEDGKTVIKDLAKGAVNVVGEGPVSVAKSDVSGVDTYTVSVKTDGKVESANTGIVTGGTVYDYFHGDTVALGKGSEATGTQSIAIGYGNKVSGNNSGAIGDPNTVEGDNSWAFGNNNKIPGSNSIVLGNNNNVSGSNTFVLGSNITADVDDAVVLGDGSKAEAGAVSVGAKGKERQIKHVADGTEDTDAATVGQLKALAGGTGAGLEEVTRRISNVDSKVNKVGAGAAALAALHPMDTDGKFSMAAGFGNYRDANAMALGLFYRPNDQVMFSMGGSLGNGENMINAGVSFALDKGVTTSKAAMARRIAAQDEKIASLEGQNAHQAAEIAALKEALARLEAKIGK